MARWLDVGSVEEFPAGGRKCLRTDAGEVVVFNLDGHRHAIANVCPHAGMPLGEGELNGCVLTCPYHGYAFDLTTGRNVDFPDDEPVRRFAVKVENGRVMVDLDASPA